jgi:hypothetical protein
VADALVAELKNTDPARTPALVNLSGDSSADSARVAREALPGTQIFAVGADAVLAAAAARPGGDLIGLSIPNGAKLPPGAYLSIYPRFDGVADWAKSRLRAARVAVLFSPANSQDAAFTLASEGKGKGLVVDPVPVASAGALVRAVEGALDKCDALVLLVDPLLFDRQLLGAVVQAATAKKKPTIGFLPELVKQGVTVTLSVDPVAAALRAIGIARSSPAERSRMSWVSEMNVSVSTESASALGLDAEVLLGH